MTNIPPSIQHPFFCFLNVYRPSSIRVQGPFKGPTNSFLVTLSLPRNLGTDKCIFLCGGDSGFGGVFSLLEYFKEHAQSLKVQSVNCMFAKTEDKSVSPVIHNFVDGLVADWDWAIPLTIVETDNIERLSVIAEHHDELLAEGMDALKWQRIFPLANNKVWFAEKKQEGEIDVEPRRRSMDTKLIYFYGHSFRHDLFPYPKWQTFVEYA